MQVYPEKKVYLFPASGWKSAKQEESARVADSTETIFSLTYFLISYDENNSVSTLLRVNDTQMEINVRLHHEHFPRCWTAKHVHKNTGAVCV